jgi:hypothetical protein
MRVIIVNDSGVIGRNRPVGIICCAVPRTSCILGRSYRPHSFDARQVRWAGCERPGKWSRYWEWKNACLFWRGPKAWQIRANRWIAGARKIFAEALRTDYWYAALRVCGGGWLMWTGWMLETPLRALTMVWIGGPEYEGWLPPPGYSEVSYTSICIPAVHTVFNLSEIISGKCPAML